MGSAVYFTATYFANALAINASSVSSSIAGVEDAMLVKLADAGATSSVSWAQGLGSSGVDQVTSLLARGTSLYLTGTFSGLTFGCGNKTLTPTPATGGNLFLARLVNGGNGFSCVWLQGVGGTSIARADLLVSTGTNLYVARRAALFPGLLAPGYGCFLAAIADAGGLPARPETSLAKVGLYPNPARKAATVSCLAAPARPACPLALPIH